MKASILCRILLGGALAFVLAGCGSSSSGTSNQSQIRTFSALVPPAGTVSTMNIEGNGTVLTGGSGVAFGQFANGGTYTQVPSGSFIVSANGAGLPSPLSFTTAPTINSGNAAYTLIPAGVVGQNGTFAPQLFLAPNYTPSTLTIPSGDVAVRVINVSANSNPVGLYTTAGGVPTAALNAGVASVPFGYSSANNGYIVLTPAQLANLALVDTTATGTALGLSASSNLNNFGFTPASAYTLYVYGQPGNASQPLGATWAQDFP